MLLDVNLYAAAVDFADAEHSYVAYLKKLRGRCAAGPREILRAHGGAVLADFHDGGDAVHGGHQSVDVVPFFDRVVPVIVIVTGERAEVIPEYVRQVAAPAVAAVIRVETVADSTICILLHIDVERGVNTQSLRVDGFRTVSAFEIFADLLEK